MLFRKIENQIESGEQSYDEEGCGQDARRNAEMAQKDLKNLKLIMKSA